MSAMLASVGSEGKEEPRSELISTPNDRAISADWIGYAIAVIHSADERLGLTMPENIRKVPTRR